MKTDSTKSRVRGFTLLEVLVVIGTVMVLILVIGAQLFPARPRIKRINCISNLKQIGLGLRTFANDHNDTFPWAVSTNQGGSMEFVATSQVFRHFQAVSNELVSPKILACKSDPKRAKAVDFVRFSNANVSYFVGLDTEEGQAQSLLSGDRNITGGVLTNGNIRLLTTNNQAGWTKEIHMDVGNIGLGDGSAQQVTARNLQQQLQQSTNEWIRLAIP